MVAQLIEHWPSKPRVAGLSPVHRSHRLLNSVGSECFPYKEEVVGSSPTEATLTNPCGKRGQLMIICKIVVMGI